MAQVLPTKPRDSDWGSVSQNGNTNASAGAMYLSSHLEFFINVTFIITGNFSVSGSVSIIAFELYIFEKSYQAAVVQFLRRRWRMCALRPCAPFPSTCDCIVSCSRDQCCQRAGYAAPPKFPFRVAEPRLRRRLLVRLPPLPSICRRRLKSARRYMLKGTQSCFCTS